MRTMRIGDTIHFYESTFTVTQVKEGGLFRAINTNGNGEQLETYDTLCAPMHGDGEYWVYIEPPLG